MVGRVRLHARVVVVLNGSALLAAQAAVFSLILSHYVAWVVCALIGTALLVTGTCLRTGQHPMRSRNGHRS